MRFAALSSGSSGNCFYIAEKNQAILVDAGISCKQILSRLTGLGENPLNIKAIFVTHEHIDHIRGIEVLSKNLNIPVYATSGTINSQTICSNENLLCEISENETIKIAGMEITSFPKSHDAEMPVSYKIQKNKIISVITDIGYACKNVISSIKESDAIILESNHDVDMLQNGSYPYFLKKRILSEKGHISNHDSSIAVRNNSSEKLKNIILAHLSEKNNTQDLALTSFKEKLSERKELTPKIIVSNKFYTTPIIKI